MAVSCMDLKPLYDHVEDLEHRVQALEELKGTVDGIEVTVNALKNNVYVKEVVKTDEGYVIKFTDNTQAVIKNGVDGQDGKTPTIGVKDVDGELFWTVNGELMKDESGDPVPATVKTPEFKFDQNAWWYRFGPTDEWKNCGEKTGPEPSIEEDEEYVYINIGDNSIAIPKEVISPAIEAITLNLGPRKNVFIPVGESADLKDFFEVNEGASKEDVEYTYAEGAFTIDDKGIVTVTGNTVAVNPDNHVPVTITAKANPEISVTLNIRTCPAPNNEEIECTCTVPEADRKYLYKEGLETFNSLVQLGGAGAFNPVNNCIGSLMGAGGNANIYFKTPDIATPELTLENGHLHLEFYVSSVEKLNIPGGYIELTSAGLDTKELLWEKEAIEGKLSAMKVGWNELDLAFKDGNDHSGTGNFDPTVVDFIRFSIPTLANHDEAFMVKNVFVYAGTPAVSEITLNLVPRKNVFIPVGESADLKDFFEVNEGASKEDVEYTYAEGAFTIDDKGIVTVTGNTVAVNPDNHVPVTITAKANPEISVTLNIRTCPAPNNEEIECTCTVPEADRKYLYKEGLETFNSLVQLGGAGAFNPVNNCIGSLMGAGGNANIYFKTPDIATPELTLENGHLHLEFYVSSVEKLNIPGGYIELTSAGLDTKELLWEKEAIEGKLSAMKVGWNELDLAFKDGNDHSGTGNFDPTVVDFIRFSIPTLANHDEAFMVKNVFVYAAAAPIEIAIDGDMSDWAGVKGYSGGESNTRIKEWKVASDENNLFFFFKVDKTKIKTSADNFDWGLYFYIGLDTDNNTATGANGGGGTSDGCEAQVCVFPWRGPNTEYTWVNGVDNNGWIKCPISGDSAGNPTVFGKVDGDYGFVEISVPKSAVGSLSSTIAVSCSMDWYATPREEVAL